MPRNYVQRAILAFLAVGVWYAMFWRGQVWAGWSPPRPTLELGVFRIAPFGEPIEPEEPELQISTRQVSVSSSVPECLTPTVTFTWNGPEDALRENGAQLLWIASGRTSDFSISVDCPHSSHLVFEFENRPNGVWGAARAGDQSSLAQGNQQAIPLSQSPTQVRWFTPLEVSFSLELNLGLPSPASVGSVTPLIAQWWQGGQVQPCHGSVGIFFSDLPCSDGWWMGGNGTQHFSHIPVSSPSPGQVIISELSWAGSFRSGESQTTDEWIEFTNLSPEPVSLQGTKLLGARSAGQILIIDSPVILAPYGTAVISRVTAENSQMKHPPAWVTSQLSLLNTQANIVWQLADGTELDRTPFGPWQVGKNTTGTAPLRATAQRHLHSVHHGGNWSSWFDCTQTEETFCQALSNRAWKSDTTTTVGTPGMLSL